MSDQFQQKHIANGTGLKTEITEKYKDMGDGTHALVVSATGVGGGDPVVGQAAMAASTPVVIASDQEAFTVTSANITTKFREAFEVLDPARWTTVVGSGDIVQVDGNTSAASYLVISKSSRKIRPSLGVINPTVI